MCPRYRGLHLSENAVPCCRFQPPRRKKHASWKQQDTVAAIARHPSETWKVWKPKTRATAPTITTRAAATTHQAGGSMALHGRLAISKKELDWSMAYQQDDRDPRAKGRGPCGLNHMPEQSYRSNQRALWWNCEVCAFRLQYAPTVCKPRTAGRCWCDALTAAAGKVARGHASQLGHLQAPQLPQVIPPGRSAYKVSDRLALNASA